MAEIVVAENPNTSTAALGKDFLVSVNGGTGALPVWKLIGGQRGSSLGRTADSIDVSSKTNNGWKSIKAGMKSHNIDLDSIIVLDDTTGDLEEGLAILEACFDQGKDANLKFEYPGGKYRTGWYAVTDFSFDTPADGEASLKGTLEGNGPLSELTTPA